MVIFFFARIHVFKKSAKTREMPGTYNYVILFKETMRLIKMLVFKKVLVAQLAETLLLDTVEVLRSSHGRDLNSCVLFCLILFKYS